MIVRFFGILAAVFAANVGAVDFNPIKYDIYLGDINGDSTDDFYFHGKTQIILLHGDIVTPILIDPQQSYSLESYSETIVESDEYGSDEYTNWYLSTEPLLTDRLSEEDISSLGLVLLQQPLDYRLVDFTNDGKVDILINDPTHNSAYIYTSTESDNSPALLVHFEGDQAVLINNQWNDIVIQDADQDGNLDIVFQDSAGQYADTTIFGGGDYSRMGYDLGLGSPRSVSLVGSSAGAFRVSESGAANYSVDISLPAGVAGVVPSVSVSYSSQSGSTIMGVGWSLNAGSWISRCRPTAFADGEAKPIQLNEEDKFCLDGQRLIPDGSGRYRTEVDNYSYIYAVDGIEGDPGYWEVISKDGSKRIYGRDRNSSVNLGSTTLSWALDSVQDNMANTIEYYYLGGVDDHRLDRIEYANTAQVQFHYDSNRPDKKSGYIAGHETTSSMRLTQIEVKEDLQTLRDYYFSYLLATPDNRVSRMHRIQECAYDEFGQQQCLEPLEFEWQAQVLSIESSPSYNFQVDSDDKQMVAFRPGDFNGDGCQDMVFGWYDRDLNSYETSYALSQNNCTDFAAAEVLTNQDYSSSDANTYQISVIDYNMDGRQDIALRYHEDATWKVHLSAPNSSSLWRPSGTATSILSSIRGDIWADTNADGLVDNVTDDQIYLMERSMNVAATSPIPYTFSSGATKPLDASGELRSFGDFNGDGNMDVVSFADGYCSAAASAPTPTPIITPTPTATSRPAPSLPDPPAPGFQIKKVGDTSSTANAVTASSITQTVQNLCLRSQNADGTEAFASLTSTQSFCSIGAGGELSDDNCFTDVQPRLDNDVLVVDFNADGFSDIIVRRGDSEYNLHLSTGIGLSAPISVPIIPSHIQHSNVDEDLMPSSVDYNRDGFPDLFWHDRVSHGLFYALWDAATSSFGEPQWIRYSADNHFHSFIDVNGDGADDLVSMINAYSDTSSAKSLDVYLNQDSRSHNLITSIDNNFGNVTEVSYERMNISAHYARLDIATPIEEMTVACPRPAFDNFGEPIFDDIYPRICTGLSVNVGDLYEALYNPLELEDTSSEEFSHPVFDLNTPMNIVASVESSAPVTGDLNNKSKVEYYYTEAKLQAGGRGFLGFKTLSTVDTQTGILTETEYRQDFPYIGMPKQTTTYTPNSQVLSTATNIYEELQPAGVDYYQPMLMSSEEITYHSGTNPDVLGDVLVDEDRELNQTLTENTYDDYGNILTTTVSTSGTYEDVHSAGGDGSISQMKKVVNTYGSQALSLFGRAFSYGQLGRLTRSESIGTRDNTDQQGKVVSFTYDTNGLLKKEVVEPDSSDESIKLTTENFYDSFGNATRVEVTGWDGQAISTRKSYVQFDTTGRYVDVSKDHFERPMQTVISRNKYGSPEEVVNGVGVTSYMRYDALGREISTEDESAENRVSTRYLSCSQVSLSCPAGAQYVVEKSIQHGVTALEYFDRLGRTMRKANQSFEGDWVYVDTQYDALSRPIAVSHPHTGTAQYWTKTSYDILGRQLTITTPTSANSEGVALSQLSYSGAVTTTINPAGQTKRETKNSFGELIKVEDNVHEGSGNYAYIRYTYNAEGNLRYTRVYPGEGASETNAIETEINYDIWGRKVAMNDPDKGNWSYTYNAFGELIRQQDAKGQVVRNRYDALGRLQSRTDYHNSAETDVENHTRWYFDGVTDHSSGEQGNALGQISAVVMTRSTSHETCDLNAQYCSYQTFDSYGRPTLGLTHVDTDNNAETALELFQQETTYDVVTGRVDTTQDAMTGWVKDSTGNTITSGLRNHYNSRGYLARTTDLATGDLLYETVKTNARGQVINSLMGPYGQVMLYDERTGQLQKQIAYVGGLWGIGDVPDPATIQHITYEWDILGNLNYRHNQSSMRNDGVSSLNRDLRESFCYDSLNRLVKTNIGTTSTSECGSVTLAEQDQRYDSVGNITYKNGVGSYTYDPVQKHAVTATSDGMTYEYDNNGNMALDRASGSVSRELNYTTFDKPSRIKKGSHTAHFAYGPSRARYVQVEVNTSVTEKNKTTVYLGNVERITYQNGQMEWRRTLPGGMQTYDTDASGNMEADEEIHYIFHDHLGSTDIIADGYGNVMQSMSFDAWGARRLQDASLSVLSALALFNFDDSYTSRGFTGHEMLDEFGLTHMNGRIYDARIGRFLQADPFIQAATDSQMYNRYSYLRNNPLNATDPSGYFLSGLWKEVRPFVGIIAGVALTFATGGFAATWYGAATIGAASGALGAAVNGGNILKGALIGGISGAAFGAIGKHFKNLGIANSGNGLTAAASGVVKFGGNILKTAQVVQQISLHALTGGVMSVLQGGKFGHGFASAGLAKAAMGGVNFDYSNQDFSDVAGRTAIASIVGGTVSEITGGKFANGAKTAGMAHLLNGELSNGLAQKRRLERIRQLREEARGSLNPFKIIVRETPNFVKEEMAMSPELREAATGLQMSALAGSMTPCSAYCAAGSTVLTGVLALDSAIKGHGRQFILDLLGTGLGKAAGLTMKNVGSMSSGASSKVDAITELSVTITIMVDDQGGPTY